MEYLRACCSACARNIDFAERTFDRGSYVVLRCLLPPHVDHILQQNYPRLVSFRNYFQRRAQGGSNGETEYQLTRLTYSSTKGAFVGAILGIVAALAKNLRVFEDFDGSLFFYPRLQFFRDLFPFLFKSGLGMALLSFSVVGSVEIARSAGLADPPSNGSRRGSAAKSGPRAVLGVAPDADLAVIKNAYRKLALKYHPDKNRHLQADDMRLVETRFREVQEAYEKLAGKEEFDATNSEFFSAEFFEMTDQQFVNMAGVAKLLATGVALAAFVRS